MLDPRSLTHLLRLPRRSGSQSFLAREEPMFPRSSLELLWGVTDQIRQWNQMTKRRSPPTKSLRGRPLQRSSEGWMWTLKKRVNNSHLVHSHKTTREECKLCSKEEVLLPMSMSKWREQKMTWLRWYNQVRAKMTWHDKVNWMMKLWKDCVERRIIWTLIQLFNSKRGLLFSTFNNWEMEISLDVLIHWWHWMIPSVQ